MKFNNEKERFDFEERSAIIQFDGGFTREQAENMAYDDILKTRYNSSVLLQSNQPENSRKTIQEVSAPLPMKLYNGAYD